MSCEHRGRGKVHSKHGACMQRHRGRIPCALDEPYLIVTPATRASSEPVMTGRRRWAGSRGAPSTPILDSCTGGPARQQGHRCAGATQGHNNEIFSKTHSSELAPHLHTNGHNSSVDKLGEVRPAAGQAARRGQREHDNVSPATRSTGPKHTQSRMTHRRAAMQPTEDAPDKGCPACPAHTAHD